MEQFTQGGVRLRRHRRSQGDINWLFLPGGPGIGSESLHGLAGAIEVPGTLWMVDLPGDGSNTVTGKTNPFEKWPHVLLEAAQALPNTVFVGHSTGGMYLLSMPELETHLVGLVLVSTAPSADWRGPFFEMTTHHPLPELDEASRRFEALPCDETLRDVAVASAPWNFTPDFVNQGRELLGRMPYNQRAVAWSDQHFDNTYASKWWPRSLPTLIVSGEEDRIVTQSLWNRLEFQGANILQRRIAGAAHFPWIEKPAAVREAFAELAALLGLI